MNLEETHRTKPDNDDDDGYDDDDVYDDDDCLR